MDGASGCIFNVQRFCVNDGAGIRTVVFLKGCPLRCAWCHNPDGISSSAEIAFYGSRCKRCGRCAAVCTEGCHSEGTFERARCKNCGACVSVCPYGALERIGRTVSAREVFEECEKDIAYYKTSGGGITLSGGEPLYQAEFSADILRLAKERGVNTAVETSGYAPRQALMRVAEFTDLFLYDFKISDEEAARTFTGSDGKKSLYNLRELDRAGKQIVLRCPIIPQVNNNGAHFSAIAALANELENVIRVEVLPYHRMGLGKRGVLGKTAAYDFAEMSDVEVRAVIEEIGSKCRKHVILA